MLQANQRIIEFLFWLRNLSSHLAWFTWLKIMIPTKNSINDNDLFLWLWHARFVTMSTITNYFCTFHFLWKCWYHVYWNLSYSLSILKVIFSKSYKFWLKKPWRNLKNKNGAIKRSTQSTEDTLNQTNFWCVYSHFCDMKS